MSKHFETMAAVWQFLSGDHLAFLQSGWLSFAQQHNRMQLRQQQQL